MKDSTDFTKKINRFKNNLQNYILDTMDERSLYKTIAHKVGIETVETTLKRSNISSNLIIFTLLLTLNRFVFNSQNYLLLKRLCPMETKCAPSYANKGYGNI